MSKSPIPLARLLLVLALGATGIALGACGSKADDAASTTSESTSTSSTTSRTTSSSTPAPKPPRHLARPTLKLDLTKRYVVTLSTNYGTIAIQLDVRHAPKTTASFAYLVKSGFYDELTFHRVAAGFVIQGGDPNGDGSGGPGYSIREPPPASLKYTSGTVAMAKTATEPAGTSGSQFFIVTAAQAPLPPEYALVGKVVGGIANVQKISRVPTNPPQDGAPTSPVTISRATLAVG